MHFSHGTALLLVQLFAQAEKMGLTLVTNVHETEKEQLLKDMAKEEEKLNAKPADNIPMALKVTPLAPSLGMNGKLGPLPGLGGGRLDSMKPGGSSNNPVLEVCI